MPNITEHTRWIKEEAHRLGFSYAGISRAEQMEEEARRLEAWLNKGRHGDMAYMANGVKITAGCRMGSSSTRSSVRRWRRLCRVSGRDIGSGDN